MHRLAIITRTLDRPVLLRRTLLSLLQQTFTDWQWLIVTPDPTLSLEPLLREHEAALAGRVKVLTYQQPVAGMRGLPLNHAIQNSDSEFITVLDDDDTWEPDFLASMVAALDRPEGAGVGGVVCQTRCLEESSVADGLKPLRDYVLNPDLRGLTLAQLAVVNQFCVHAFVYRRAALAKSGLYPEDYPVLEDWHFNLRFLRHHDVLVLPRVLGTYHQRPSVISGLEANSLHAELDLHKLFESRLINDWLREDLDAGKAGLGMVLAAAAQQRTVLDRLHRLEGRVRVMSEKVGKIDSRTKEMKSKRI